MGIPDEPFWSPPELVEAYRKHVGTVGAAARTAWADAQRRRRRHARVAGGVERHGRSRLDRRPPDVRARRVEGDPPGDPGGVRRHRRIRSPASSPAPPTSPATPAPSSPGRRSQSAEDPGGRQIYYGVREHAMGAAMVGMAMHGGILPVGGTFFVFPDYMRPPIRLAALSQGQGGLRLLPRLGRRRRGRADPPTRRAARHDQGDPRPAGDPPGRRQRDRRGVEGHRRARRPDGARPQPPGHRGRHRRLGRRARRRHRARTRSAPRQSSCSPPAARSRCASTPRRDSPVTASRRAS